MKTKIIALVTIIIILVISITFSISTIMGNKSKEISIAKDFVKKLQKMDIIDTKLNMDEIEFKSIEKVASEDSKTQFTVIAENLGIDLNSKYVITGFSQKLNQSNTENIINEDDAKIIAVKYVDQIISEKFKFKEIRKVKVGEEEPSTYTIVFYKYIKEYPYFDNEIIVSINKSTGKLENYTNPSIDKVKHNLKKSINVRNAEKISTDYFNKLNIKGDIKGTPLLAVILDVNGEYQLSYIVDAESINLDNNIDKYKLFINAESGEIVNKTNDLIESSISN